MSGLRYLLDTNILSALVHDPFGPVAAKVQLHGIDTVATSIIVASELRFGAEKAGSARLVARIDALLDELAVLPFDRPADRLYGKTRAALAQRGTPIGPTDLFIAAHALALDLTLITGNIDEFSRVPDLRIENWLD